MNSPIANNFNYQRINDNNDLEKNLPLLLPKNDNILSNGISMRQAIFSLLSIFVGLGLLSKPFALKSGGLISYLYLFIICLTCMETAKIFPKCFQKNIDIKSYDKLAENILGYKIGIFITFLIFLEYFLANCISLLFIWKNLVSFFNRININNIDLEIILISISVISITIIIFLTIKKQTLLNFLGVSICISITIMLSIVFFIKYYKKDHIYIPRNYENIYHTSTSLGIYITSFSGHASLPCIYQNMKNKNNYSKVINISFITIIILYISISLFGYMVYGDDVDIIIVDNILHYPDGILSFIIVWMVITKCYLSTPTYIYVLSNGIEDRFNISIKNYKRLVRILLFGLVAFVSYIGKDNLPFIESFTGTLCSIPVSIIIPTILYLKLYWKDLSCIRKFEYMNIIICGTILSIGLTTLNIISLVNDK